MEEVLGTSSCKHGCGGVAFRLNFPGCETLFISEELGMGCRFRNLNCAVYCNGIEMEFPLAGWVSSRKVNLIWKLLVKLLESY